MRRDDLDIDEILKRYFPRAPQEEMEAAGAEVLERIRSLRFGSVPAAPDAVEEPKAEWLPKFQRALLTAVDELRDEATPVKITLRKQELLEARIVSGKAV